MIGNKNPVHIFIGAEQREIVKKIDEGNFLGLDKNTPRIDLFMFALALGIEGKIPSEIKKPDSFIRDEYVKPKHDALLYAVFFSETDDKDDLDAFLNKDAVYKLAQNYAIRGFDEIGLLMETKNPNSIESKYIQEMDEAYNKIFEQ